MRRAGSLSLARPRKTLEDLPALPEGVRGQPDVFWIAPGREETVRGWVYDAPDLVVEVICPTHPARDRIVKHALYARAGVWEYWIADPADRTIEVLALEGAAYRPAGYFPSGARGVSAVLPGLVLVVDEVFARPPSGIQSGTPRAGLATAAASASWAASRRRRRA